jgi:hypothetical protein
VSCRLPCLPKRVSSFHIVAAENDLARPLDPYPGGKVKPGYIDIFHVDTEPKTKAPATSAALRRDKEPLLEPPKKKGDMQRANISIPPPVIVKQNVVRAYNGILPEPPVYTSTPAFEWNEPKAVKPEPPKPPPAAPELIPIASDLPLTRADLSALVGSHALEFMDKWKTHVNLELDWNTQQWGDRLDLIMKLKAEREEMKRRGFDQEKEKEKPAARLETPEKGKRKVK